MIHNIAFKANWNGIQKRKPYLIDKSNNEKMRVAYLMNVR
jgi:hypothetical protein